MPGLRVWRIAVLVALGVATLVLLYLFLFPHRVVS
jgi:hypothetical protein